MMRILKNSVYYLIFTADSSSDAPDARSPGSSGRSSLPFIHDRWADGLRHPGSTRSDGRASRLPPPPVLLAHLLAQPSFNAPSVSAASRPSSTG